MASVKQTASISDYQNFVNEVYGFSNTKNFSVGELLTQMERFTMRGLKGIRKGNKEKIRLNLIVAYSWLMSLMNQFHFNLQEEVWNRFPYRCSYCGECPCSCKQDKVKKRIELSSRPKSRKPGTIGEFQTMFRKIYPPETRSLEHAGIHLAEELGEFAESIITFRGNHKEKDFKRIGIEAADFYSCMMGVFNSIDLDLPKELSKLYSNNCYVCHNLPCTCSFDFIVKFKS